MYDLSHKYKLYVVGFTFFLLFLHFYAMAVYPDSLIAGKTSLIIVLCFIVFIWIQELKDRRRLEMLNKNLISAQIKLEHAEIDAIAALILAEEEKDSYTRGHSKRVSLFALTIAKEINMTDEEQKVVERSGILHDIGKIGIVDNILSKADALDEDEWKIMKEHPQRALSILKPLNFLSKEKDIVLCHHERLDGSGYPNGLKGADIPLGARIVAVADTFDAMNSLRLYRRPLPKEMIISELKQSARFHLDKRVVDVFLKILEQSPSFWEQGSF